MSILHNPFVFGLHQFISSDFYEILELRDMFLCLFQMGFFAEAGPVQIFVSNHVSTIYFLSLLFYL